MLCAGLGVLRLLARDGIDLDEFAIATRQRLGRGNRRTRSGDRSACARDLRLIGCGIDPVERLSGMHQIAFLKQTGKDEAVHLRTDVRRLIGAHRLMSVPLRASVYIAGGAAGVAAAFNTPLAGVAFAIEELAAAYEQRMALLVMAAVLIAGMVSLGLAGDYVYFGVMRQTLNVHEALVAAPVAGVIGGLAGACFSRFMLGMGRSTRTPIRWMRERPVRFAAGCGLVVALLGAATGLTWGTGYQTAHAVIAGSDVPIWFGAAKFAATLATAVSGIPGGIFAPSLSVGAGIGDVLRSMFPAYPAGAIVLLGMVAYFTGVVRAPLTAVIIISETTASRGLMMPLLATALIADFAAQLISKERLYHGLSRRFETGPGHKAHP